MNLITQEKGQIQINEEYLGKLKEFQTKKKEMDELEKSIKNGMKEIMEQQGIKSFENDLIKITYVEPTTRTTIDSKLIDEMGLRHILSKETPVKASVRMSWK